MAIPLSPLCGGGPPPDELRLSHQGVQWSRRKRDVVDLVRRVLRAVEDRRASGVTGVGRGYGPVVTTAPVQAGARAAGGVLAGTLGAIALLTRRKPLHAKGRTHHAVLRVDAPAVGTGVRLLSERAQHQCLVRLSRALSTPDGWWDIGGFALRIEHAGAGRGPDLLFASTGVSQVGRHVLRVTRHRWTSR